MKHVLRAQTLAGFGAGRRGRAPDHALASATWAATRPTSCRCTGTPTGWPRAPGRFRRRPSSASTRSRSAASGKQAASWTSGSIPRRGVPRAADEGRPCSCRPSRRSARRAVPPTSPCSYLAGGGAGRPAGRPARADPRPQPFAAARGFERMHLRQRRGHGGHRARSRFGRGGGGRRADRRRACTSASELDARRRRHRARRDHRPAGGRRRRASCSPSSSSATRTARRRPSPRRCRCGRPRWLAGIDPAAALGGVRRRRSRARRRRARHRRPTRSPARRCGSTPSTRSTYSHRKRLVGGFYAYEHVERDAPAPRHLCRARPTPTAAPRCRAPPPARGQPDPAGDGHRRRRAALPPRTPTSVGARATSDWWFAARPATASTCCPRSARYEPGETARLQVRMPFREATALVTVEREGIARARVVPLSRQRPGASRCRCAATYAPNVFVSVLAVRGRVGDVQPTALVDLGKPAFKLGIAEIRVGWRDTRARRSTCSADRPVYRVRDKAAVQHRRAHAGRRAAAGRAARSRSPPSTRGCSSCAEHELEAARRDDGPARLRRAHRDRADAGGRQAPLRPEGAAARRRRRAAERRASCSTRCCCGAARVPLDAAGDAAVEVPLNDSLTSFRIVAVATGGAGTFGTGATSIRSTQDLMLLSGLPPLVREGDDFRAEFTVRNTTEQPMRGHAARPASTGLAADAAAAERSTLAAGEARVVGWEVTVPGRRRPAALRRRCGRGGGGAARSPAGHAAGAPGGAGADAAGDAAARWSSRSSSRCARPADALPGRGGVDVSLAPIARRSTLDGVRDWMRALSLHLPRAARVARRRPAATRRRWNVDRAPCRRTSTRDGLLKYFPTAARAARC